MMIQEQIEEKDVIKTPGHPWRRYFAFILDLSIYSLIVDIILYHMMPFYPPKGSFVSDILTFLVYVLMIPLDAMLMAKFGTTIGKYLFGISVTHESGRNLTFSEAFLRNFNRLRYGAGFTIPFYSLYRNFKCYQACSDGETMKWDEEISYVVQEIKLPVYIGFTTIYIIVSVLEIAVNISANFPNQTDDGTVHTFVENYNEMLSNVFEINSVYLDENGYMQKTDLNPHNDKDEIITVGFGEKPVKVFEFVEKDGKLCEITSSGKMSDFIFDMVYSTYNSVALYTIATSQDDFHVWDYSKCTGFLTRFEEHLQSKEYQETFKNITVSQETINWGTEDREINIKITIN